MHRAKIGLIEAKRYLNMVITEAGIKVLNELSNNICIYQ